MTIDLRPIVILKPWLKLRLRRDDFLVHLSLGDSVEFFVLDCRSERQEETREGAEAIYISRAQMDWLKSALADSPCHFKAILTSVPITAWPELLSVVIDDRWEGYRSQREELLDWIVEEDVSNVFFISGDFHCGAVTRVEPSGPRSGLYEVLVGPGGNANNPLALLWELGSDGTRRFSPCGSVLVSTISACGHHDHL